MSQTKAPVFVHSLFRSGSTYLFNVFRRARTRAGDRPYTVFQESLHEQMIWSTTDRDLLLSSGADGAQVDRLRHPDIGEAYFQEAYDIYESWRPFADPRIVYDDYFGAVSPSETKAFFAALMKAAPARPVFQECRSSMRVARLKEAFGGLHVHLWRNPWDQWWSTRLSGYFEAAMLLCMEADGRPDAVTRLIGELQVVDTRNRPLGERIEVFRQRPLNARDSYKLFYTAWLFALMHARAHCDVDINIDRLSSDPAYADAIKDQLKRFGVEGLDFSDCKTPQAVFGRRDEAFFAPIEKSVEQMLVASSVEPSGLATAIAWRVQHAPAPGAGPAGPAAAASMATENLRDTFRRHIDEISVDRSAANHEIVMTHLRLQDAHRDLAAARQTTDKALGQLEALSTNVDAAVKAALDAVESAYQASLALQADRISELETTYKTLEDSFSVLKTTLDEKNATIAAIEGTLSWRLLQRVSRIIERAGSYLRKPLA